MANTLLKPPPFIKKIEIVPQLCRGKIGPPPSDTKQASKLCVLCALGKIICSSAAKFEIGPMKPKIHRLFSVFRAYRIFEYRIALLTTLINTVPSKRTLHNKQSTKQEDQPRQYGTV